MPTRPPRPHVKQALKLTLFGIIVDDDELTKLSTWHVRMNTMMRTVRRPRREFEKQADVGLTPFAVFNAGGNSSFLEDWDIVGLSEDLNVRIVSTYSSATVHAIKLLKVTGNDTFENVFPADASKLTVTIGGDGVGTKLDFAGALELESMSAYIVRLYIGESNTPEDEVCFWTSMM